MRPTLKEMFIWFIFNLIWETSAPDARHCPVKYIGHQGQFHIYHTGKGQQLSLSCTYTPVRPYTYCLLVCVHLVSIPKDGCNLVKVSLVIPRPYGMVSRYLYYVCIGPPVCGVCECVCVCVCSGQQRPPPPPPPPSWVARHCKLNSKSGAPPPPLPHRPPTSCNQSLAGERRAALSLIVPNPSEPV